MTSITTARAALSSAAPATTLSATLPAESAEKSSATPDGKDSTAQNVSINHIYHLRLVFSAHVSAFREKNNNNKLRRYGCNRRLCDSNEGRWPNNGTRAID